MKLGQILRGRGLVTREQVKAALLRQRLAGRPLGRALVEMGIVSSADVCEAMLTQANASISSHDLARVSDVDVARLPTVLCEQLVCVAIVEVNDRLIVAFADPLDAEATDAAAQAAGQPVTAIAARADDICRRLRRFVGSRLATDHADAR